MRLRRSIPFALLLVPLLARAQAAPSVRVEPERPVAGTLFHLVVEGTTAPAGGTVAGEPLHFARDSSGMWRSLAAVRVDAPDSVLVRVAIDSSAIERWVHVARGDYRLERLTVAPTFGRAPDSAVTARLVAESILVARVVRESHARPRLWTSAWVAPRPGRVTSGFGHGRQFNGVVQSRHTGVDYAGAVGSPIRVANTGIVALVDRFHLGGNVVYVDHGEGLTTAYLHLSRTDVAAGDTVRAGQVIGRVGATGRVTGPHLHWIARLGAVSFDGRGLLDVGRGPWPARTEP